MYSVRNKSRLRLIYIIQPYIINYGKIIHDTSFQKINAHTYHIIFILRYSQLKDNRENVL